MKNKTDKQQVWVMVGDSESGDHYDPKVFNYRPRDADKKKYILDNDGEINIGGPGEFGSYVFLEITKTDLETKNCPEL
jgi:hypothetical protein